MRHSLPAVREGTGQGKTVSQLIPVPLKNGYPTQTSLMGIRELRWRLTEAMWNQVRPLSFGSPQKAPSLSMSPSTQHVGNTWVMLKSIRKETTNSVTSHYFPSKESGISA